MKPYGAGQKLMVVLWVGLLASACNDSTAVQEADKSSDHSEAALMQEQAQEQAQKQVQEQAQELKVGDRGPEFGHDYEGTLEGDEEPVTPIIETVLWDEADAHRQIARDRLSAEQLDAVDNADVPALLPDKEAYIARAMTMYDDHWFAASIGFEEHDVALTGTRMSYFVPGVSDMQKEQVEGANDHILTRESGIVTLSFSWFGVSYFIEVSCAAPFEDARCTEDAYIMDLAESLAVVAGGKR